MRLFEEEAEAERQRAMKEAASFGGCYPALVTTLLHLLPQKVTQTPNPPNPNNLHASALPESPFVRCLWHASRESCRTLLAGQWVI